MSPGTVLGERYRLEDLLADHDGARFWRATDTVLSRSVAVHAVASDDPRADAVLEAARLSATVTDPHFLRVLDCDDDGRLAWVINEWGSGVSLDLMLQRGPLPPARAAWLTREVAEAIARAHSDGVAHGRLNPEAVLVTEAGAVKVIGFVTNRAFEGPVAVSHGYGDLDDRAADVIDLAGILYAALTGKWPGAAPSSVPRAPREAGHPLRPRQVRAGVPRALDTICERVLHHGGRHVHGIDSAFEIAAALSDYVGDPSAAAPLDVPSMHAEPTRAISRSELREVLEHARPPRPAAADLGQDGDPAATQAAPLPRAETEEGPAAPAPRGEPSPGEASIPFEEPGFEQPAERPLFADHERRVPPGAAPPPPPRPPSRTSTPASGTFGTGTGTNTGTNTGTGTGTGDFWPFPEADDEGGFTGKEGRGWLRLAGIVALVIAVLAGMFLAFTLGRGGDDEPAAGPQGDSGSSVGAAVQVVRADDFDPEGDPPEENPDEVPRAIDGKADTGWRTLTYTRPNLGGLKSGVGLVLDLGTAHDVGSVHVSFGGEPTEVSLYAAPETASSPPRELADVDRVVASTSAQSSIVLRPGEEVRTRYLVLWITELPKAAGDGYRAEVREVTVHS